MKNFDYARPQDVQSAAAALGKAKGSRPKGGGTDLITLMKSGVLTPPLVVDLASIPGLSGVSRLETGHFRVGATTTIAEVAEHPELARVARVLTDAAATTATPLVRNRGTVGGNLCQRPRCWYFRNLDYVCSKKGGQTCYAAEGENKYHAIFENVTCNIVHPSNLAPALWALDATIHVAGPTGEKSIPVADFWVRPEEDISTENVLEAGEVITGVSFAPEGASTGSAYHEVREKQSYDWALVNAAVRLDFEGEVVKEARIVVSAVAPIPLRLEACEKILKGQKFSDALAEAAGKAASGGATPLRDNAYKVHLIEKCVKNTILDAARRAKVRSGEPR